MGSESHHTLARVVQFDNFELRLDTRELRKNGIRIRLQTKPFQILSALLEQPGQVVTREELRSRLWASDTFVDFESGLNTAANRLRLALSDSADHPRYIETLARVGYRFIAAVREAPPRDNGVPVEIPVNAAEESDNIDSIEQARHSRRQPPVSTSVVVGGIAALVLLVAAALVFSMATTERNETPTFHQITFQRGVIENARFTPAGEVVYSARWGTAKSGLFLTDVVSPESRDLRFGEAALSGISSKSELAIFRKPDEDPHSAHQLVRVPLNGGAPRMVDKSIAAASWSPDGAALALVRYTKPEFTIEFPAGKVLYRSSAFVSDLRVAPDGSTLAFLEHPLLDDDGGNVMAVDASGRVRHLSDGWSSLHGLAWEPSGREVWFTAAKTGLQYGLYAVSRSGRLRQIGFEPGVLTLFDISPSRRVLTARTTQRLNLVTGTIGQHGNRDSSWFDWTRAVAMSADGRELLFDESGSGGGANYSVYLRHLDSGTVERMGDGRALDLSADGQWAITQAKDTPSQLYLISTGDSQRKVLKLANLTYQSVRFLPDLKRILVIANSRDGPLQLLVQDLSSGAIRTIRGVGPLGHMLPSPDGRFVVGRESEKTLAIVSLINERKISIPLAHSTTPVRWIDDRTIILEQDDSVPIQLERLNVQSQEITPFAAIPLTDNAGFGGRSNILLSADLRTYAFSCFQTLSDLYVVDGWR